MFVERVLLPPRLVQKSNSRLLRLVKWMEKLKLEMQRHADTPRYVLAVTDTYYTDRQSDSSVNLAAGAFVEMIKSFASVCIPNKTITISPNNKPWYDKKQSKRR